MKPRTLKRARKVMQLTQEALGKELGYTRQSVERWERGVHPIPLLVDRYITQKMDGERQADGLHSHLGKEA